MYQPLWEGTKLLPKKLLSMMNRSMLTMILVTSAFVLAMY